jgi:hypothetical protein
MVDFSIASIIANNWISIAVGIATIVFAFAWLFADPQ